MLLSFNKQNQNEKEHGGAMGNQAICLVANIVNKNFDPEAKKKQNYFTEEGKVCRTISLSLLLMRALSNFSFSLYPSPPQEILRNGEPRKSNPAPSLPPPSTSTSARSFAGARNAPRPTIKAARTDQIRIREHRLQQEAFFHSRFDDGNCFREKPAQQNLINLIKIFSFRNVNIERSF